MRREPDEDRRALNLFHHMLDVEMRFMQSPSKDVAMLSAAFHSEVVIHQPKSLPYAGDWKGLEGLARLFGKMSEIWSDMRLDDVEAALVNDTLFVKATIRLTFRATGAVIEQPFAEVLRFQNDLLLDGTPFYYDTGEIVAILNR